jgi:Domain of unknown function (DUF1707)/Cell wall-active antibiotics response 4TMS YvqF
VTLDEEPTAGPGGQRWRVSPSSERASDDQREATAEALRAATVQGRLDYEDLEARLAAAFTATTRADLHALVADLGADPGAPFVRPLAEVAEASPTRFGLALMRGRRRTGGWLVAKRCSFVTVMGSSEIDLNAARLIDPDTRIRIVTIMGGATIRVPVGLDVRVAELAIMGGNDVEVGTRLAAPAGPVVRLQLLSIMGAAKVRRGRRRTRRRPPRA